MSFHSPPGEWKAKGEPWVRGPRRRAGSSDQPWASRSSCLSWARGRAFSGHPWKVPSTGKKHVANRLWNQAAWVQILAVLLTGYIALDNLLNFSVPQFRICKMSILHKDVDIIK